MCELTRYDPKSEPTGETKTAVVPKGRPAGEDSIQPVNPDTSECLEAVRTISALATNYGVPFLMRSWDRSLLPIICDLMAGSAPSIRFAALKLVEALVRSLSRDSDSSAKDEMNQRDCPPLHVVWQALLHSPLLDLFKDASHAIRASACTCLSHFSSPSFAVLSVDSQHRTGM